MNRPTITYLSEIKRGDQFQFVDLETGEDAISIYSDGPFTATDDAMLRRNHPGHVIVPIDTHAGKAAVFDLPMDTAIRLVNHAHPVAPRHIGGSAERQRDRAWREHNDPH